MLRHPTSLILIVASLAVTTAAVRPARAQADGGAPAPAPVAPPAPAACTGSVDGHVVDAVTHEAVAGATVRRSSDGEVAVATPSADTDDVLALTDGDGRFRLDGVCPGPIVLAIGRDDYATGLQRLDVRGHASFELELDVGGEVIVLEEDAPEAIDMRSTTSLSGAALERTRGRGLAAALAEVPGVAQLGSGTGLAKPIVRGQYGRRLLLLVDGVRHRAQEWGLDHAPEVDPFVAERLTVVRGAAGVRFGPDAIGGAVLVEPPELPHLPGTRADVHLIGFGNSLGGSVAARVQHALAQAPTLAFQLEGSFKRLAAANTPRYALDNAGATEWNLGGAVGGHLLGGEHRLAYSHYQATLGVCTCLRIESSDDFLAQLTRDEPLSADLYRSDFMVERPYQQVGHDLGLVRSRWAWDGTGTLTTSLAVQHDHRREFDVVRDATTGPQFDFRLMTADLSAAFEHRPLHLSDHLHLHGEAGVVALGQLHEYAGLPLVPDFTAAGGGLYAIERLVGHDFELEAGVRVDALVRSASLERRDYLRLVRSGQLAMDACSEGDGDPVTCGSRFGMVSASLGGLYQLTHAWSGKLDLSTASRPPTTDEQYLNGTSPTFPVLALGKPDLGRETTLGATATTTYQGERVAAEVSVFANRISDYIEFAPAVDAMGNPIFDVLIRGTFPRFITRPVDATFWGADGGVTVTPWPWLELGVQASAVRARNRAGGYLTFVPADRARGSVTVRRATLAGLRNPSATVTGEVVARQDRFDLRADLATPPAGYGLLGAELGADLPMGEQAVRVALAGSNLTNTRYRDYTSLLRYFADQPGWQVLLRLSLHVGPT